MATHPTRFENHLDLDRLPWFERREDRLVLSQDLGHEVIDIHVHLALTYIRKTTVDLWKEHPRTHHYLPMERPLDLDAYHNKNFTLADRKKMEGDLTWGSTTSSGMRETHTAANLLAEMRDLGIGRAVMLPIDFPALSHNAETYLEISRRTDSLPSFGSVHPHARNATQKLEKQKAMGAKGIKVHPAVQTVAADNPRAMKLYRACGELGLPILWHCGPVGIEPRLGRHLSQVKNYWEPIVAFPETTFILGHSGALQFEMALDLAKRYENVYLDLTCQGLINTRRVMAEAPQERVLFGSDWPFYHQGPQLAKTLIATDGDESARKRVLFENAARLLGLS